MGVDGRVVGVGAQDRHSGTKCSEVLRNRGENRKDYRLKRRRVRRKRSFRSAAEVKANNPAFGRGEGRFEFGYWERGRPPSKR